MVDVTYCVALPVIAVDDGIAAGEPTECFNPVAVIMARGSFVAQAGTCRSRAFSRTVDPATGS